jgi:hypothetical protein
MHNPHEGIIQAYQSVDRRNYIGLASTVCFKKNHCSSEDGDASFEQARLDQ